MKKHGQFNSESPLILKGPFKKGLDTSQSTNNLNNSHDKYSFLDLQKMNQSSHNA